MTEAFRGVGVVRVRDGVRVDDRDRTATEEPLEVRLHNQPFAVMRGRNFSIYAHPERIATLAHA